MASRPPSPKSDTEFEIHHQKFDSSASQTLLTGTGDEINDLTGSGGAQADNIRWEWGELPETMGEVVARAPEGEERQQTAASAKGNFFLVQNVVNYNCLSNWKGSRGRRALWELFSIECVWGEVLRFEYFKTEK